MKILDNKEWLAWRKQGVGASDAPAIMGASPWKSPYQFWRERYFDIDTPSTPAMQHGKKYEDAALDWFEGQMGVKLNRQLRVEDPEFNWMRSTLDGITEDRSCLVEAKSPYDLRNHEKTVRSKRVPDIYFPQLQHQMRTANVRSMYFLSYDWKHPENSVIVEVRRDAPYIDQLIGKEQHMWECIKNGTPPPMSAKDTVDMENNTGWAYYVESIKAIDEQLEVLKARREECKSNMISMAGARSARGNGIILRHSVCEGGIDYQRAIDDYLANMQEHYPEIDFPPIGLEPYRKKSFEKWSIRDIRKV